MNNFIDKHSKQPSRDSLLYEVFKKEADQARHLESVGVMSVQDFPFTTTHDIEKLDLDRIQANNIEWAKIEALLFMNSIHHLLVSFRPSFPLTINLE
jgi:hypothetical protein